jgi:hypothetical protein
MTKSKAQASNIELIFYYHYTPGIKSERITNTIHELIRGSALPVSLLRKSFPPKNEKNENRPRNSRMNTDSALSKSSL